jgi:CHAT domain-containing protein/Tfp pilus assembly protein PilF
LRSMRCASRTIRRPLLLIPALLAACQETERQAPRSAGPEPPARPVVERTIRLAPGFAEEAELANGSARAYLFDLSPGWFAGLTVEQKGIDVALALYGPAGRRLAGADSSFGAGGPEPLPFVAGTAGRYRLEVSSAPGARPGRCELRVEALRPATPRDRKRVAAERLFGSGEELRQGGNWQAIAAAAQRERQALAAFHALGEHGRAADVSYHLGNVYASLEQNATALELHRQALEQFRALGRDWEAGRALTAIGQDHRALGEPRQALASYREALPLGRRLGDRWAEAATLTNLGKLHDSLGESGKALDHYERALALWRELGSRREEASTLANLGNLYQALGELQKALDYLEPALAIRRAEGSLPKTASLLTSIGGVYSRSGRGREAAESLEQALRIQRRLGDRRGEAVTLNDLGWVHLLMDRPSEARAFGARALTIFREIADRSGQARALVTVGWADDELKAPRRAIASFTQALELLAPFEDRDTEAAALFGLARARRSLGDLTGALAAVEHGLHRVEALRGESASPAIRTSFLASKQRFYSFHIDLLMDLARRHPGSGYEAQALAASEKARARSLLDLLAEAGTELRQSIDPRLLAREAETARQVNEAERHRFQLAAAGAPPSQIAAAERDLRLRLTRYDRAQSEIRVASPRYAAFAQGRPLAVREIQRQVVDKDTLLLEYALGEERSFLWAVTPESIVSFELPAEAMIEETARRAHQLLAAGRQTLARGPSSLALAELSRLLLQPAAGLMAGKRLLIVADGALHYVPFAALPAPGSIVPLAAEHEIVMASSASSLALLRRETQGRRPPPGLLAVVADPVFGAGDPRLTGRRTSSMALASLRGPASPKGFQRLPFSREEAESILALAPRDRRLGALGLAANRETVLGGELGRYRVVHFATHGMLDETHPELSGLMLSQMRPDGTPRDGFVRAHEIYRLHLPADLVVLSACRTALGREIRGEGLVGLTRGFQYAGARRVLVSLWEVEDRATAELMRLFYREMLERGQPPAAALRSAQLALRRQPGWQAPYYWAGFVLHGDWRSGPEH